MKRILCIVLCLFIVFSQSVPVSSDITNWTIEEASQTYENIPGTVIWCELSVSEEDRASAALAWCLLPVSIREGLAASGCRIFLTDSAGTTTSSSGYSRMAVFSFDLGSGEIIEAVSDPYIVVRTESPDITGTILHETGHILDGTLLLLKEGVYEGESELVSTREEWREILAVCGDALTAYDRNAERGEDEAFAVAFKAAFEDPETAAELFPEALDFVCRIVQEYEAEG